MVAGFTDSNGEAFPDIFLHDRDTGSQVLVSHAFAGAHIGHNDTGSGTQLHGVSADGRWVVFQSDASNLLASGQAVLNGMYLYDRDNGQVRLVSGDPGPALTGGRLYGFNADASRLLFTSFSGLWIWNRLRDERTLVTRRWDDQALLSPGGDVVALTTTAIGLTEAASDGGPWQDVYVAPVVDLAVVRLFADGFED